MMPAFTFLYGPPGSGKTSLGRLLAESLHRPFYDLDEIIASQAGHSIPEIFAAEGEPVFRQRESIALEGLLSQQPGVVALGGGALLDGGNRQKVEAAGRVVCLTATFETLLERLQAAEAQRPLLLGDPRSRLNALLASRAEHYATFPLQLESDSVPLSELTWMAQVRLGAFRVEGMGQGYDVRVVDGAVGQLGQALAEYGLKGPLAFVSDGNVAPLYAAEALDSLRRAGFRAQLITIAAGEANKDMETVQRILQGFLKGGLERGSTVIALGGGVVGDLAGFAAAVNLRGVPWVTVPTSLLAMVDASLGGKTGADLPQGKNLVGAFHAPSLVLADPAVLTTLPVPELRNGLAEVVKHGLIGDPGLFEMCEQGWAALDGRWEEIVRRAMAVKIRVIRDDPYEKGSRASLNLGHTLGHALELASDFKIKHGEAVAIGMVTAAHLAEEMGMAESGLYHRLADVLTGLGLPVTIPASLDRQRILQAVSVDKKRSGGKVRFVLPVRVGEVRWGIEISDLAQIL